MDCKDFIISSASNGQLLPTEKLLRVGYQTYHICQSSNGYQGRWWDTLMDKGVSVTNGNKTKLCRKCLSSNERQFIKQKIK
jgi:hypothetical protein